MGRKGDGVEINGSAIRLSFTWDGVRRRELLLLNGKSMPPTAANMRYAYWIAQEIRERIRCGTFSMVEYFPSGRTGSGALTVADWLGTWLDAQSVENSTKAGYQSAVRFWNTAAAGRDRKIPIGALALRALKPSHLLTALAGRPDLTGKTINNYVSVMRQALELAVADKLLSGNPADELPRAKHQKPPPDPFLRDECEAIIADMVRYYPDPIRNLVEAWFFTGLRTSEIFGLRWSNIDLRGQKVLVAEAMVRGEHKDNTKTNVARTVLLNSRALSAINRQAKHSRLPGEQCMA